ncbi:hypothetical protein AMAG_00560 [Allomyces macrogynus ATCC 38327]|uniref:Uncharacterized protein n=1 Tax=Allomyces macrogynus (strain ATCC 38327) TaxID=578462 RepID=A0A0L0RWT7_ALLM3|nr:hypothetical protein AMAG_00560 [Allomyces macrogynus ATCC 38327]|eukprot:KNE54595.1 hypothetical protein AMAG_00560 [Allomyces macrogynus ATCC 38327]
MDVSTLACVAAPLLLTGAALYWLGRVHGAGPAATSKDATTPRAASLPGEFAPAGSGKNKNKKRAGKNKAQSSETANDEASRKTLTVPDARDAEVTKNAAASASMPAGKGKQAAGKGKQGKQAGKQGAQAQNSKPTSAESTTSAKQGSNPPRPASPPRAGIPARDPSPVRDPSPAPSTESDQDDENADGDDGAWISVNSGPRAATRKAPRTEDDFWRKFSTTVAPTPPQRRAGRNAAAAAPEVIPAKGPVPFSGLRDVAPDLVEDGSDEDDDENGGDQRASSSSSPAGLRVLSIVGSAPARRKRPPPKPPAEPTMTKLQRRNQRRREEEKAVKAAQEKERQKRLFQHRMEQSRAAAEAVRLKREGPPRAVPAGAKDGPKDTSVWRTGSGTIVPPTQDADSVAAEFLWKTV